MPAHFPAVDAEKIWDIVNFVLALPYEPALLDGATLPGALAPAAVAAKEQAARELAVEVSPSGGRHRHPGAIEKK